MCASRRSSSTRVTTALIPVLSTRARRISAAAGEYEEETMIKRIISLPNGVRGSEPEDKWLAVEELAEVELTSEDPDFPIESAIARGREGRGWRAAGQGEQIIRLIFNEPNAMRRIKLQFSEHQRERTQEFVLRWSNGGPFREIVRQQWTFSPPGTTNEVEDYRVNLDQVRIIELMLKPDLHPNNAVASLAIWRIA
jgi:hypothetical protein